MFVRKVSILIKMDNKKNTEILKKSLLPYQLVKADLFFHLFFLRGGGKIRSGILGLVYVQEIKSLMQSQTKSA